MSAAVQNPLTVLSALLEREDIIFTGSIEFDIGDLERRCVAVLTDIIEDDEHRTEMPDEMVAAILRCIEEAQ